MSDHVGLEQSSSPHYRSLRIEPVTGWWSKWKATLISTRQPPQPPSGQKIDYTPTEVDGPCFYSRSRERAISRARRKADVHAATRRAMASKTEMIEL